MCARWAHKIEVEEYLPDDTKHADPAEITEGYVRETGAQTSPRVGSPESQHPLPKRSTVLRTFSNLCRRWIHVWC